MTELVGDACTLKRTRTAKKGWVTNAINNLKAAIKKDTHDITVCLEELVKRVEGWEQVQTAYELAVKDAGCNW